MIQGFEDKEAFAEALHSHLSPTTPIQSPEHLFGRKKQMQQIEQALYSPGRSVFVYGDRGVGKTSLALTVAHRYQSARRAPVMQICTATTTFGSLVAGVLDALSSSETQNEKDHSYRGKVGASLPGGYGGSIELERSVKAQEYRSLSLTLDLNTAVSRLLRISESRREDTVVLVDEFDRIANEMERSYFADFIKQLGDQSVPIRFIFCGVAESLNRLLGAHASAYRYIEAVEVPRLGHDARYEIIDGAALAFKIKIDERPRHRIAAISDGFPHYIHLVCEKLFWRMFYDAALTSIASAGQYQEAIAEAVIGIEPHLKATYEEATMKAASGYEDVLWAIADHADLIRSTEDIFNSYERLFGNDEEHLDRSKVVSRLSVLKEKACGHILTSERVGFYHFRENIMRGYVRLRAEDEGYELATDFASSSASGATFQQRGARRSRGGVRRPMWRSTDIPTDGS
jgi:uncharacterized protein